MNHSSRKFRRTLSIFIGIILFPHLLTAQSESLDDKIRRQVSHMTLDQKAGQLFIFGFPQNELTPELSTFLKKEKPGAFVIFKRNISSLSKIKVLNQGLTDLSKKYSGLAPLLAVDQEGGSVVRISTLPPMPNALALGQTKSPELAQAMGAESSVLLKELGFNMNLAPVLDVADPLQFSFIGVRSFGSDPQVVGDMGLYFSKGLIKGGIVPTGKHFPGTGSSQIDPHHSLATNQASREDFFKKDLPPFAEFSRLGFFSALMISQFSYPHLDSSGLPAVFSPKIVTELLRKKMNFRGLVITDDLQMSAARTLLKPDEAALTALKSGADLVMLTWSFAEQEKAVLRVKKAITSGEISATDLNEKLFRIAKVKYYLSAPTVPHNLNLTTGSIASEKFGQLDDAILDRNLASTSAAKEKSGSHLCLFSSSNQFLHSFKQAYSTSLTTKLMDANTQAKALEEFYHTKKCDGLLFTIVGRRTAKILSGLSKALKEKTIVANLSTPSLLAQTKSYKQVLNLYFPHQNAGKKIAQLLNENYAILNF